MIAAACNSICDNLVHHFFKSIFNNPKRFTPRFWNVDISNAKPIYFPYSKYKIDAWHIFKSLMLTFLLLSILSFNTTNFTIGGLIVLFIAYGFCWIITFNLMYNKILNKK